MRLFICAGILALLVGSAAGQAFKPRSGANSAATIKTKSGFKRKAKAKRQAKAKPTSEVIIEDDPVDDKEDTERAPTRKASKSERAEDSEMERASTSRAKQSAPRTATKRWDPDFVLITDEDE